MVARALVGLRYWDGSNAPASDDVVTIRFEGERIAAIGTGRELTDGAEVIDLGGATALPGLIDAHVHLALDPGIRSPEDQDKLDPEERERAMVARAAAMVAAGITTARDLGGPDTAAIELRDRIARGVFCGPRLVCAGQPLTTRKGHCWFWGGEAESDAELEEGVERQVAGDCDWIKVMATGGVITKGSSPAAAQYSTDQLRRIVETAKRHGRPVAAHAHGTAGIRNAAAACVDTVEHCSFVGEDGGFGSACDADVVALLAENRVRVSPTINAGWRRFEEKDGKPTRTFERVCASLAKLREAGVTLIASTDAGIPRVTHDQLPRALAVFARYAKFTPVEALRSATSVSAEALGLAAETGRLQRGLAADVLVVEGDPTRDLGALERVVRVYARGREATAGA